MTESSVRMFRPLFRSPRSRIAYLRNGLQSTYVVPGDWVPSSQAEEMVRTYGHTDMLGEASRVEDNEVEFYVDGRDTYLAIADELDDLIDSDASERAGFLVIHVGWTCYLDTPMGGTRRTYRNYMSALVAAGIKTRALFWEGSIMPGLFGDRSALQAAATYINGLTPSGVARAYTDDNTRYSGPINTGSHHQKLWLILGRRHLTAYFGGVDVHPNRVNASASFKDPWHDVHARVRGPAAERFLGIALWRLMGAVSWYGHPVPAPEATPPASAGTSHPPAVRAHAQQVAVHELYEHWNSNKSRITRRFPNSALRVHGKVRVHAGSTIGNPALEQAGWTSEIHYMVAHAIEQARRFVYVEDQYFWHHEMATRLGRQVQQNAIKQLIVVTNVSGPGPGGGESLAEHPAHTRLGLWYLARAAGSAVDKIMVFERIGTAGRYVHAKMFIYDDVAAHVGSANFNNRGYATDSESAGVFVDRILDAHNWHSLESTLARKLRVMLWKKHLGIDEPHLYDALGATAYWRELATRTGSPTAPVGPGTRAPTVGPVTIDGQRWADWARAHASIEPPTDVGVTAETTTDGADWVVDPA